MINVKKLITLFFVLIMAMSLCACSENTPEPDNIHGKTENDLTGPTIVLSPILGTWNIKYIFDYDGYSQEDVSDNKDYDDFITFSDAGIYVMNLYDEMYTGYWGFDVNKGVYVLSTEENGNFFMSMNETEDKISMIYNENYLISFVRKPSTD